MTQLFNAAPDLLEDFKQFLPESAAQAKAQAQAAARQQYEEAGMATNMRGLSEHPHSTGNLRNQAQTPRPADMKMPPLGTFAPPSVGKDNKKRRGGAGSTLTVGANAADTGLGASSRNRNVNTSNKVRFLQGIIMLVIALATYFTLIMK